VVQIAALRAAEAKKSMGKWRAERKPSGRSLADCWTRSRPGDVVTVTRLDRLARFTRDLLNTLAALTDKEADFRSVGGHHHSARAPYADGAGGLAEFGRDLIRARTGEGRERAKARGAKLGRKPKLARHQQR
jgi:DNA invertase Pin-like site-specific DNA recombinase